MREQNGFFYMRARYYDPKVGRFISEDPIGFEGGDTNLYAYVGNNPVMGVDAWGMCTSAYGLGNDVIYDYGDYSESRSGGSRSWRNNNPGNLIPSPFSLANGSVGRAGGFAVFPNYSTGYSALTSLLQTGTYQSLTVNQAVARFAPPSQNNTASYQNFIRTQTGLSPSAMLNSLSEQQIYSIANTIQRMEGWREGTIFSYP